MIEFTDKVAPFDTYCEILGYDPQDCLFFDIETTGLSAASSMVFLIGTLHFDGADWILRQRLAESYDEETSLVEAFVAEAARYRTIIHFNGSTFDIPFLNAKAKELHIQESLDLYQRFRPMKKLLSLTRMSQASLEAFVGWQRTDTAAGSDMAGLYREYIRTASLAKVAWAMPAQTGSSAGDSSTVNATQAKCCLAQTDTSARDYSAGLRSVLLLHNHDDIVGMTHILRLAAYPALLGGQTGPQSAACEIIGKAAVFHFLLKYTLPHPLTLQFTFKNAPESTLTLQARDREATLAVPLTCGELRCFFPDYRNYYYLPLENQAIHKSVGAYVDKMHREPAKPANCCVRKTGHFLPQPEELFTPCLRKSYESKALYFECTDDFLKDTEKISLYIIRCLAHSRG